MRDPLAYLGVKPKKIANVKVTDTAPTTSWLGFDLGDIVVDKTNEAAYILVSKASGSATWDKLTNETGSITTAMLADDAVTTAKLDPTTIQYASVSLTNANIKALAATQIELVAAAGAGTVVEFVSAQLKLVYGTNVLTEAGDNLAIKYTDASGVAVSETIEATGFIDQAADTYTNAIPVKDTIVAATGAENQALVLDNLGSEFAGNAAADTTMEIGIAYRVHTL